jgi:hypothetical protein
MSAACLRPCARRERAPHRRKRQGVRRSYADITAGRMAVKRWGGQSRRLTAGAYAGGEQASDHRQLPISSSGAAQINTTLATGPRRAAHSARARRVA